MEITFDSILGSIDNSSPPPNKSSPLLGQMLWRSKWKDQLKNTSAAECLRVGKPDDFPLSEVQAITDALLQSSHAGLLQVGVRPQTAAADSILVNELQALEGRLRHYETGLLAALHALSPGEARQRLVHLTPDTAFANHHFDDTVAIYLQCVIIAHRARGSMACNEKELYAARELFGLVKAIKRRSFEHMPRDLPKIWGLLRACGEGTVDELLPLGLVKTVISRSTYGKIFREEVYRLQQACLWSELHDLVAGATDLIRFPDVHQALFLFLPQSAFPALVKWRPSLSRIKLWSSKMDVKQRAAALPILQLEGPDTTGNQGETLRHSTPGAFKQLSGAPLHEGVSMMSQLLEAFDKALETGSGSLQWILFACARRPELKTPKMLLSALETWELVRKRGHDIDLPSLKNYLNWLEDSSETGLATSINIVAAAIPVIGCTSEMQASYGRKYDLENRASDLLTKGQQHFCELIGQKPAGGQQIGLRIRALARVMLDATWMHHVWTAAYVDTLRRFPTEMEVRKAFTLIRRAEELLNHDSGDETLITTQKDFLAERIGGVLRPGQTPSNTPPVAEELNTWLEQPLDADRAELREIMQSVIKNIPVPLLAACIEQSLPAVHDDFVRDLNSLLLADTDQVCVNIANFLGPRMVPGTKRTHKCWVDLLMHMMEQRPLGMMDRCGERLSRETWTSWVKNLERLYGDGHFGQAAGLGFTVEGFARWTSQKRPPMRGVSTASTPATSGGRRLLAQDVTVTRSSTTANHRRNRDLEDDRTK